VIRTVETNMTLAEVNVL